MGFGIALPIFGSILLTYGRELRPDDIFYITLGVSLALAIIGGILFTCLVSLGLTIAGFGFGVYLSILLYQFGTVHINTTTWTVWQIYFLVFGPMLVLGLLFAIVAHKVNNVKLAMMKLFTSFCRYHTSCSRLHQASEEHT